MFSKSVTSVLFLASLASAHFGIQYPEMRGDPMAEGASQRMFPCGNLNQTSETNRTLWPLEGGSVSLKLYHSWTYVFVNLGLGSDNPRFNISLTPNLLNQTGKGDFCLPKLALPESVKPEEGQNATIQVITVGRSGSAMYTCADITFSNDSSIQSGESCSNSSNVAAAAMHASPPTSPPSTGAAIVNKAAMGAGFAVVMGGLVMGHLI